MTAVQTFFTLALLTVLALACAQDFGNEVPTVLSYNSPLRQPDSLRSRPYFDFLSTLYRHDTTKSSLFQPYLHRSRREVAAPVAVSPIQKPRDRRAIVFRPLFVYRQQEVRKQKLADRRRRH